MKKTYALGSIIIIANLLNTSTAIAQDARFAQSYSNPLRLNPAIMGASKDVKLSLNYRSQFANVDGGYKTVSFTGMYPLMEKNSKNKFDIGVNVMNDKAGAYKTLDFALALDYVKELSPHNNVCLSILGGYAQKSLDVENQIFDNQYVNGSYNASNPSGELALNNKVSHPDLGFGFMWFYNADRKDAKLNAYLGFSGFHINQPNQSFENGEAKLPMRFSYQAGLKIFSGKRMDISPNIRVNNQNGNIEPAAGLYIDYHLNANFKCVVGGWYRAHDALALVVGFDHKNYSLGYSYDLINSGLNDVSTGIRANEITLSIKLRPYTKKKKGTEQVNPNAELDENGVPIPETNSSTYSNPFSSF
jgi:type IX secretion system PorP/SprF family membrane protein